METRKATNYVKKVLSLSSNQRNANYNKKLPFPSLELASIRKLRHHDCLKVIGEMGLTWSKWGAAAAVQENDTAIVRIHTPTL